MTDVQQGLDMLYMPIDLKQTFCLDLLESAGAERISVRENRNEILHCCLMPWHNESRPSASLNFDKMVYKCLGCQSQGGILWLIGTVQGVDGVQARQWLSEQTGFGGSEFLLAPLIQFLDAVDEAKKKGRRLTPIPKFSERVLEPWDQIYPGLTTGVPDLGIPGRGIPEDNLIEARIGWDMDAMRVIIPHFWHDDLVGWQARRIIESEPEKYKSTVDFPRDSTLYRLPQGKRVVVFEAPLSVVQHLHHQPCTSPFGANITEHQIGHLRWYPEIIFMMDNDPAGWMVAEGRWDRQGHHPGAAEILSAYSRVKVVEYDWAGDPQDLSEDIVSNLVDDAVPLEVWERPTGALRCLACKKNHGGPCP